MTGKRAGDVRKGGAPARGTHTKKASPAARRAAGEAGAGTTQKKEAAAYSPALHCSTIGASGLNFSVRNGKRWDTTAITT